MLGVGSGKWAGVAYLKVGANAVVVCNAITNAGGIAEAAAAASPSASVEAALAGIQPGVIQRTLSLPSLFPTLPVPSGPRLCTEMVDLSTKVQH